ncbi:MAG: glycosyltransferase [Candidatus Odinarchaeia archaeon]
MNIIKEQSNELIVDINKFTWKWSKINGNWMLAGIFYNNEKIAFQPEPYEITYEKNGKVIREKLNLDTFTYDENKIIFSSHHPNFWDFKLVYDFTEDTPKIKGIIKPSATVKIILWECPIIAYNENNINYAFVGGIRYVRTPDFDIVNREYDFGYPFSTYYKTKIPPVEINGKWFRSALYTKMPIIVFDSGERFFGAVYTPVEKTSKGREIVHSVRFEGSKRSTIGKNLFSLGYCAHTIFRKKNIWLGQHPKPQPLELILESDEEAYTTITLLFGEGKWMNAVSKFLNMLNLKAEVDKVVYSKVAAETENAFWRAWDNKLKTFLQLPFKNSPGFVFDDLLFGLTSFEAERLSCFHKYYVKTGNASFKKWWKALRKLLLTRPVYEYKDGYRIWHNGITYNGVSIEGYTYLRTGYAGYPGGQATIALHLLKLYEQRLEWENIEDRNVLNAALDALDWIISTQKENGAWRCAIKIFKEYPVRRINYEQLETVGGSAECIRALILAYKITGEKKYLDTALKGLKWLNPPNYACLGYNYLRDAGINEEEGISAIIAAHANLDAYEVTLNENYLDYAIAWAKYMLTWHFWWSADKLPIFSGFDPLSWSITPRVAPYETAFVLSVYARLFNITGDMFWKQIFDKTYATLLNFREKDGGLSETYFFDYLNGLADIPIQQTFAANELLNASMQGEEIGKKVKFVNKNGNIVLVYRSPYLKEVKLKGKEIEIHLENQSNEYVSGLIIESPELKGKKVELNGVEIISRTSSSVYGLSLPPRGKLDVVVKSEPESNIRVKGIPVDNIFATWIPDEDTIKITYSGENVNISLRNLPFTELEAVYDENAHTSIHLKAPNGKLVLKAPDGTHEIKLKPINETVHSKWWNSDWKFRVPILIFNKGISEGPLILSLKEIVNKINCKIPASSIRVVQEGEEISAQVLTDEEYLSSDDEILCLPKRDKNAKHLKLYLYFSDEKKHITNRKPEITAELNGDRVVFKQLKNGKWNRILSFNFKDASILELNNNRGENCLGDRGVGVSFWDPYTSKSAIKIALKRAMRKYQFRWMLASGNAKDALYGISPRESVNKLKLATFNMPKKIEYTVKIYNTKGSCIKFKFKTSTEFHEVSGKGYVLLIENSPVVIFNPLRIKVLSEDLTDCKQVLIPYIDVANLKDLKISVKNGWVEALTDSGKKVIWGIFNTERTTGRTFDRGLRSDSIIGVDVTLKTNWVHAGLYNQCSLLALSDQTPSEMISKVNSMLDHEYLVGSLETIKPEKTLDKGAAVGRRINVTMIYPGATHGIYHYVTHLRQYLNKIGVFSYGFYFPEEKNAPPIDKQDLTLETLLKIGEFYFVLPKKKEAVERLIDFHKKNRYDILHLHWPTTTWDNYAVEAARKLGIPLVVNLHYALSLQDTPYGMLSRIMYRLAERYLGDVDAIIVTSKSQESFVKSLGFKNVHHIPTGVDTNVFRPVKSKSKENKIITYVGRISPEKNLEPLIEAFLKSNAKKHAKLYIVGKGPLLPTLKAKYRDPHVIFTGYIPEEEKIKLLQNTDLFVSITKMELMSISVLEAMACGVPVITSRIEAFEEFVSRDVGRMVDLDKNLTANLENTIEELLFNEDKLAEMGRMARKKVVKLCSWENVSRKILKVYERVLDGGY